MRDAKPAASIDAYLKTVPEPMRAALQKLREQIRAAAPEAVETIAYQMPAFKLNGKPLAYFAAFRDHCSYFPVGGKALDAMPEAAKAFRTAKGTLQFTPGKPLPAALVKRLVKARIADIRGR
ncbi:MAG: DUF1801 domain-containing protein [Cucumibacter sp.]